MVKKSDHHADLVALLLKRSVQHGSFKLASGRTSSYYVDARPTTMSAQGLQLVGQLGLEAVRQARWTAAWVGGLTMGADPVAYAIARASLDHPPTLDAFSVRKEAKDHGRGRRIEGNFAAGGRVIVVEDTITSGGSALSAIEAIRAEGGVVVGVVAVIDREEGGRAAIERAGYEVRALVTATDLGLVPHQ